MSELARVRWKCRRGMLELDILLSNFIDRTYSQLDAAERHCFNRLLDCPDAVLLAWLMGRIRPIDKDVLRLVDKIRSATAT